MKLSIRDKRPEIWKMSNSTQTSSPAQDESKMTAVDPSNSGMTESCETPAHLKSPKSLDYASPTSARTCASAAEAKPCGL